MSNPIAAGHQRLPLKGWQRTLSIRIVMQLMKPLREMRASQFAMLNAGHGGIVFLGDSLTEFGEWAEWFPDAPVVNRGIAGDVSAGVLARLESAINAPRGVFLLIGTNDVSLGVPVSRIVANVGEILLRIERLAPSTRVYLQSVMPRSAEYTHDLDTLNAAYRQLAAAAADRIKYVDLWPALAATDGTLRAEFTGDQVHLTGAGYSAWVDVIRPLVASLETTSTCDCSRGSPS
jgi:lysophospholipase L1-like esterase